MTISDQARASIAPLVAKALAEDTGRDDSTTSMLDTDDIVGASVIANETLLLSGQLWVDEVFAQLDDTVIVDWYIGDNENAEADDVICKLVGPSRSLVAGKKTALNFLRTLSSTASTRSKNAVDIAMIFKIG